MMQANMSTSGSCGKQSTVFVIAQATPCYCAQACYGLRGVLGFWSTKGPLHLSFSIKSGVMVYTFLLNLSNVVDLVAPVCHSLSLRKFFVRCKHCIITYVTVELLFVV
jgi:hypothetical protein